MRNPERPRNVALVLFLAGPVTALSAFALPASTGSLRGAVFTLGLMFLLFGGVGAFVFQQAVKAKRRATPAQEAQRQVEAIVALAGGPAIPGDDGSRDPEDLATCWKCGFETYKVGMACERCGANMQTRRSARKTGALLVVIGSLLGCGMLYGLVMMLPTLLHPGEEIGGTTFNGSPGMAMFVIMLLGGIAMFGFTFMGYGIFQMRTGRRSATMVRIAFAVAAIFMALGFLARRGML